MNWLIYSFACWPAVAIILTIVLCLLINRAKNNKGKLCDCNQGRLACTCKNQ